MDSKRYCFDSKRLKMMKLICVLVFLAYANAATYRDCDSNSPVSIRLQQLPDPLVLRSGTTIPVKALLNVKSPLPARVKVYVKVEKKMWFYVKLPCIKNLGSCNYDFDCQSIAKICPSCQCPLPAGQLNIDESIKVPSISIPSFLANGKYRISFEVKNAADNSRLACGQLIVSIKT